MKASSITVEPIKSIKSHNKYQNLKIPPVLARGGLNSNVTRAVEKSLPRLDSSSAIR